MLNRSRFSLRHVIVPHPAFCCALCPKHVLSSRLTALTLAGDLLHRTHDQRRCCVADSTSAGTAAVGVADVVPCPRSALISSVLHCPPARSSTSPFPRSLRDPSVVVERLILVSSPDSFRPRGSNPTTLAPCNACIEPCLALGG